MDFLRENLKKMNNPDRDELTDAQRHGRAKGIYDRMKEEVLRLNSILQILSKMQSNRY